ncbi:single-stranded DNA-binding protein [Nocardia arthritidis]|uniref:Single-stranded DNA-binding protein n=1 Tax=Nocardia arthritidis TaxID=228602 RepID=A0A6G9YC52_9NOCA|nr:single-stranded DNA-binding protein [Nocardia arthritidis]
MSGETTLTVIGNLTDDPRLTFVKGEGTAVVNFTVASTPRIFDRESNKWKDGAALFLRVTMWREPAENIAESLTKGARVMVTGKLQQRSYEDRDGVTRYVMEVVADEVGVSLKYAVAKPIKRKNNAWGDNTNRGGKSTPSTGRGRRSAPADDDPRSEFTPDEVA